MAPYPYLSICSGIGGLDLGVELGSGGRTVPICYLEREAAAAGVLADAMARGILPQGYVWSDLKSFGRHIWPADFAGIVGGYPCQPFSVSGHQRGSADPRHLFPAISRLVAEYRPGWCFFENVAAHLALGYFTEVKPTLEGLGYRVEEQILRASQVGASHRRERLFILAVDDTPSRFSDLLPIEDGAPGEEPRAADHLVTSSGALVRPSDTGWQDVGDADQGRQGSVPLVSPCSDEGGQESTAHNDSGASRRLARTSSPPYFDDDTGWDIALEQYPQGAPVYQPRVRPLVDGSAARIGLRPEFQLHGLGNSVVPAQAALAWRLLWAEVLS